MIVGFLCGEYPPCNNGGIGTFTKLIAEGLVRKGHKVIVFGMYRSSIMKVLSEDLSLIDGVKVIRWPFFNKTHFHHLNEFLSRIVLKYRMEKLVRSEGIDIIEAYDSEGLLPFGSSVKLITRLHGSIKYFGKELNRPYSRYISFFEKMQLRKSDLLIGVSKYVHIKTLEYFSIKKPSIVIYNAVRLRDIRIEFESSQRPKEILYFGSIIPKKGVEELVLAFNSISNERNNLSLKLIGKSNAEKNGMCYTDYLLSLLSDVNKGRFQILSHLQSEDLKNEIQNSYCCVFPSFVECFAIAPMEAMALGRPVIYSTLHSGPELIEDGVDGILVDPNNIMVLAEKIMYLISNPQIAEEMGVNGRRKIEEKFSFDSWIKLNVEMYIALKRNNI